MGKGLLEPPYQCPRQFKMNSLTEDTSTESLASSFNGSDWVKDLIKEDDEEYLDQEEYEVIVHPEWLSWMETVLRTYVTLVLTVVGFLFNLLSVGALFNKRITFQKLLRYLFVLLNLSDS